MRNRWLRERWREYLEDDTWRCPQGGAHHWVYNPPVRHCIHCGKEEPIPEEELVTPTTADTSNNLTLREKEDIVAAYRERHRFSAMLENEE